MAVLLRKIQNPNNQVEHMLNDLTDAVRRIVNFTATGNGVSMTQTPSGTSVSISNTSKARRMFIAEVDTDATGGGYYNCYLQTLDADDWESDTDLCDDTGDDTVVVLNLVESGSAVHNLDANDKIICWKKPDDEGNTRYVGVEVFGRHTFGEW